MSDLISRKVAIDAFINESNLTENKGDIAGLHLAVSMIESLPSAEPKTGEWISEELANMICNEICYYKEVTVDADSLNDLCEGCLIKKMKYDKPTGKWIKSDILPNGWHCSHCDSPVMTDDIEEMLFCPNCGSRMKGADNE